MNSKRFPEIASKMQRLSPRLKTVYDHLLPHQDVWDFCCDHGYLGVAAYKSENFQNIYFVDPVISILKKLESQFFQYAHNKENRSNAHFILQKGQQIKMPVLGTASLVGVGGLLIYEILDGLASNSFLQSQRLILGPQRDTEKLLTLLKSNAFLRHYSLSQRKEVLENGRQRTILIYDRT